MYVDSYVLDHNQQKINLDFGRKRGTFGLFRKLSEKVNLHPVYMSLEHPDSYFYFLYDDTRWNLQNGFWKFAKGKGGTLAEHVENMKNDKSVSGFDAVF